LEGEKKPVTSTALSLIAGLLFLFVGFVIMSAEGGNRLAMGLMIISGSLMTVAAVFLYRFPKYHVIWGMLIFLSSPLSLVSYVFYTSPAIYITIVVPVITIIFFMILGMVGGASAIAFEPEEKSTF